MYLDAIFFFFFEIKSRIGLRNRFNTDIYIRCNRRVWGFIYDVLLLLLLYVPIRDKSISTKFIIMRVYIYVYKICKTYYIFLNFSDQ